MPRNEDADDETTIAFGRYSGMDWRTPPSIPHTQTPSHNLLRRSSRWYFTQPHGTSDDALDVVAWWEIRRIPYNLLVGTAGIASIALWLSVGSLPLMADRANSADAVGVEPLAALAAPFLFNVCYTAGSFSDVVLSRLGVRHTGPILLKLGTALSLAIVSFVGMYWFLALLFVLVSVLIGTAI